MYMRVPPIPGRRAEGLLCVVLLSGKKDYGLRARYTRATRQAAPIAANGRDADFVVGTGVGTAVGAAVGSGVAGANPTGGTTLITKTETGCGPVMPYCPDAQVSDGASPFTKLTETLDPSFLALYVNDCRGRSVFFIATAPLLVTETVADTAVQVVP